MTKYEIIYSKDYKKAIKKLNKNVLPEIEYVIDKLANDEILEIKFKDSRECHIKPNLLLI